jgi:hypothetical protein
MMNAVLTAVPNPGADADRVLLPERSILRSLNEARPEEFVERLVVPLSVPLPERMDRVTDTPDAVTSLPSESRTCTVTGGERGDPGTAFVGC